jgi:hypothetical protein
VGTGTRGTLQSALEEAQGGEPEVLVPQPHRHGGTGAHMRALVSYLWPLQDTGV